MTHFPKWLRRTAALALGCSLLASAPAMAQQKFINILTGGTSGAYYPLGVALSQVFAKDMAGVKTQVQATKASAENMNLLQAERGELAFALGDTVSDAVKGDKESGFAKPLDKLRGLAAIYPNYVQVVVAADSGINTLADLKGKRVSVGAARSGTELNARAVLKAAGLTYQDLGKVEYLPFAESVELMKNRQIDATLQSAAQGVASIRDLSTAVRIKILPIPADVVARIGDPAYQSGQIAANTYTGQPEAVPTARIQNMLVTHSGVSDDMAYQMTKLLMGNLPALQSAHAAAKDIDPRTAAQMPLPLHPGAQRYYKEAGLIK